MGAIEATQLSSALDAWNRGSRPAGPHAASEEPRGRKGVDRELSWWLEKKQRRERNNAVLVAVQGCPLEIMAAPRTGEGTMHPASADTSTDASVTADGMTAREAVDRIEAAGQPRPHDRRLHARGAVYEARYVPTGHIAGLTTAAYLMTETEAVVRFSNGAPKFDEDDRTRGIRGMAVKFLAEGKAVTDLVAANFRVFPSRNPEGFIDLVEATSGANAEGSFPNRAKAKITAAGKFAGVLTQHPESHAGLKDFRSRQAPASFATTRFDGLHAFLFVDADGNRRPFRYRLVPQLGEVNLDSALAEKLAPDFLIPELDRRLEAGPVTFTLVVQLAEPGDPTDDPSKAWPENRTLLPTGHIHITRRSPAEDDWQRQVFDPTRLGPGVEMSDDPVLRFRPHTYSVSADRRLAP